MSLPCTARNFFFGTEMLGTMPTLANGHSFRFAGNIINTGSSHPPPIRSVASIIGSVFPDRSLGARHPTVVRFIGSIASEHRKRFCNRFWVRAPRCAVCTIPRDDHTMTPPPPPPNTLHVKKRQILTLCYRPSNHHHHHHHHPYIKCTNVCCSATPQREATPATMASRGQSQGPDAGPDSLSAGFPLPRPPSPHHLPPSTTAPLPHTPVS